MQSKRKPTSYEVRSYCEQGNVRD